MRDRCVEEQKRIGNDIQSTVKYFSVFHDKILSAVNSMVDVCGRAVLLKKLFYLEPFLENLWSIAEKHSHLTGSLEPFEPLPNLFFKRHTEDNIAIAGVTEQCDVNQQVSYVDEFDSDVDLSSDDDNENY